MSPISFATTFEIPASNTGIQPQTLCPSNAPLVLLPVRLETRFFTTGGVTELRVRVYPDKIHVDSHHRELTTDERTSGTQYWQQDWAGGGDTAARSEAWHALATRFGPERAAWIARVLEPTNIQQRPTGTPVFPTLPPIGTNGEDTWRRAPRVDLLPDRWVAIVHSAKKVALMVTGNPITRPLAVGPDPGAAVPDATTEAAIRAGDQLAIDDDMLWMVDFDQAEDVGMGLRITVPAAVLTAGIDSLVVFGVATSLGATNTAAQFADLLDCHHYTDGLEFLRHGTPTNNTDDRRTAFSTDDRAHVRSFAHEVQANPQAAPNAARLGKALGLPPSRIAPTLGRIALADKNLDLDLRSMNSALWSVGWGYYLSNMMGPETGLSTASVDWARRYFVDYVRCAGPLPAIRCGAQPYGILPVTSTELWAPGASEGVPPQEIWLRDFLKTMRDKIWRPMADRALRVGVRSNPGPDADADLADLMTIDGVSHSVLTREVLGRHYVEHLHLLNDVSFTAAATAQESIALAMLQALGLPMQAAQKPRAARSFYGAVNKLTGPLVQTGEISPWQPLQPNYIQLLLQKPTIKDLIDARPAPTSLDRMTSLLESLLRHSLLREIAIAAARLAADAQGTNLGALLRDFELVDLVNVPLQGHVIPTPPTSKIWRRQLDAKRTSDPSGPTIRDYLQGLNTFTDPAVVALGEVRASLGHLMTLDTELLQLLMLGTLDLSTHRLDAWITSLATKRLDLMTASGNTGQYVGAYGWVENLAPTKTAPTQVPQASLPPGEAAPLFFLPNDTGFIHAPSMDQASAAAILRNAHLGSTGIPTPGGPFAIDLSSRRVREATRLLDGVRQGQPLGALLGYRFERRLHDLKLDKYIAPIRKLAPLTTRQREDDDASAPTESVAADNVVDALVLIDRWRRNDSVIESTLDAVPGTDDAEQAKVTGEIDALIDAMDGLSDALTAEATYEMVRGNTSRLANTLSAISNGEATPPELEVARMPRTGNTLTHRVAALFCGTPNSGAGWALPYNATPRPLSERWQHAWVRQLLGDARKVRCTVERVDDATGNVAETVVFTLGEVPVTPLDFMYFVAPAGQAGADGAMSYAEQLVLYHARRRTTGGFTGPGTIRLQHARPINLAPGEVTLFDVVEMARTVRRLLESSRGLLPDDITPPGVSSAALIDVTDLEARVVRLENSLNTFHKALVTQVAKGHAALAEDIRTALLNLGLLGFAQTVPCVAVGDAPSIRSALLRQAAAVLKESGPRLDRTLTLRALPVLTDQRARTGQLIERGQAAAGQELVMLPCFTCDASSATELTGAFGASTAQQGGDVLAVHGWFTRTARVRENLARLASTLRLTEALETGHRINMVIAQLPFLSSERWVGLPPLPNTELPANKLSLVVQSTLPVKPSLALSGLLFDEWVEIVPSKDEATAITFQFDPPNSVAPQNVLIAVPPVPGQDWTTESLRAVLMETLDLAKLRGVDPSLLGAAAQYLPALYVPFNAADDVVSTDFVPLTV